jgi:hypothetical protein
VSGIDILSLDQGPGIANIGESLRDGHSTAGSLGTGLGAIRRQSSLFDVFSVAGQGTAVFSRVWQHSPPELGFSSDTHSAPNLPPEMVVGTVCLPVRGEQACGDAWAMKAGRDVTFFLLVDGLGHGPDAATAANRAVEVFEKNKLSCPADFLHLIHAALHGTRGAAVAVAEVSLKSGLVRYAGVGNLSGLIISAGTSHNLVSHCGTAGVAARNIREFSLPWPDHGLLVLHSDGIQTHWSLSDYPGLARKHPALIAGVLYRDNQRQRDDSTVVVARAAEPRSVA